jgi:hypothetical protein
VRQATLSELDRGGSKSAGTARVLLTGTDSERAAAEYAYTICVRDPNYSKYIGDVHEVREVTRDIVARDSPVTTGAGRDGINRYVWAFGDDPVDDVVSVADRFEALHVLVLDPVTFGETAGEIADRLAALTDLDATVSLRVSRYNDWVTISTARLGPVLAGLRLADSLGIQLQREVDKDDIRRWCDWEKDGGRAGLGFEWVDGELVPGTDYDEVCATLELVMTGEMSKRKAASHLNTSPRTISRAIEDRSARYGL